MKELIKKVKVNKKIAIAIPLIIVVAILCGIFFIKNGAISLSATKDMATLHYSTKSNIEASKQIKIDTSGRKDLKLVLKNPNINVADYIFYSITDSKKNILDEGIIHPDDDTYMKIDLSKGDKKKVSLNITYLGSEGSSIDFKVKLMLQEKNVEPVSTLIDGDSLNKKMIKLANNGEIPEHTFYGKNEQNIQSIKVANTIEDKYKVPENIVSLEKETKPIYMWYKDHTIYFYCEQKIALNANSDSTFRSLEALKDINDLKYFDTSQVTTMSSMFWGDKNLSDIHSLAYFDTTNVKSMSYFFNTCTSLNDITPLYAFDTSNVEYLDSMFCYTAIKDINPVKYFDTSKVIDMSGIFTGTKITDLDALANWDTSNVEELNSTFSETFIADVNGLRKWNTSKVKTIIGIFSSCFKLTDISGIKDWDTSSMETMYYAFTNIRITDLDSLRNWKTNNLKLIDGIFSGIRTLKNINGIRNWNVSQVESLEECFEDTGFSDTTPLENWNISNVTNMKKTFSHTKIKNVDGLKKWDVSKVKTFESCFYYSSIENVNGLENWNLDAAENMQEMFTLTQKLKDTQGIKNWNISKVSNFEGMFYKSNAKLPSWNGEWNNNGTFVKKV